MPIDEAPVPWWHETTIYQVYPRSFADSDGDGIGDLRGIIDRLDHVADLGVGTIWVSPFFTSPQVDFGYDISDYCGVAPEYGTLADAAELIDEAHARGLRVMFDLVLNHSSEEHPWFVESRSSRDNPKADWYLWRDGRGPGGRRAPNNWRSALEVKTAWQWGEERGQWYLASFLPCQPDLNWRNPDVKAAMFDVVRFWLDRGVDGFRLDMFGAIMKDPDWRDNPFRPTPSRVFPRLWPRVHTENTADNVTLARELRAVCDEYEPERVLLGEIFGSAEVLQRFTGGPAGNGLQLVFLFEFLTFRYDAAWFRAVIEGFEEAFPAPAQPTYVLENHDRGRSPDRVGGDEEKTRVLATILLTVRGVPTLYMGQEIGMRNTYLPLREALDPIVQQFFSWLPELVSKRLPERINRDEVRTPMQWDGTVHAGFCPPDVAPWLPVNPDHRTRNVIAEAGEPWSMLELQRRLLRVRRDRPALHRGTLRFLTGPGPDVVAFEREAGDDRVIVAANLGHRPTRVALPPGSDLLVASAEDVQLEGSFLHLPPDRAAVVGTPAGR